MEVHNRNLETHIYLIFVYHWDGYELGAGQSQTPVVFRPYWLLKQAKRKVLGLQDLGTNLRVQDKSYSDKNTFYRNDREIAINS